MTVGKYWWLKVVALGLALAGVLWMMSSLQSGSYFENPNSPVQMLIGTEPEAASQPAGIPAKVQFTDAPHVASGTRR